MRRPSRNPQADQADTEQAPLNPLETAETIETANSIKSISSNETFETVQAVRAAETFNTNETIETADAAETVDTARGGVRSADGEEAVVEVRNLSIAFRTAAETADERSAGQAAERTAETSDERADERAPRQSPGRAAEQAGGKAGEKIAGRAAGQAGGFCFREVVHGLSFSLRRGETLALVGESGCGKTVSASSILKLLDPEKAVYPSGEIIYRGENILEMDNERLRRIRGNRVSMIFQEPMSSLNPLHTVERQIGEIIMLHDDVDSREASRRSLSLITQAGIRNPGARLKAYPHELSGGERQRVMIAMALANRPDVLIADEPTTALDVTIQAQILDLMAHLQREYRMALLFITHDLGVVHRISDRVIVMKDGYEIESGPTREVFSNPRKEYTRSLIELERGSSARACGEKRESSLVVKDLKVWFPVKSSFLRRTVDYVKAVDGVSLSLAAGESVGIVGESGSGKTTLAKAILGLVPMREGSVMIDEREIHKLPRKELRGMRREIQFIFQDPFGSLNPRMTLGEIVLEGVRLHRVIDAASGEGGEKALLDSILREVGLEPGMAERYPHQLSGGQRQRIAIARALVLKPKILALDEPTSSLDRSVQFQVIQLLRRLQEEHGLAYLFISHDLKVVRALCRRVMIMHRGRIVEEGAAEEIFRSPREAYTRELIQAAFG